MEMDAFFERMVDETYGYEAHEHRKSPKKKKKKIVFRESDIIPECTSKGNFELSDTKKSKKKEKKEEILSSDLLLNVDDSVLVKEVKKKKKVLTEQRKEVQGEKIIEDRDLPSEPNKKKKKKETGIKNGLVSENDQSKETKKEKKKKLKNHEAAMKDAKSKVKVTTVKGTTSEMNTAEERVISSLFDEPADWDAPLLPGEQVRTAFYRRYAISGPAVVTKNINLS